MVLKTVPQALLTLTQYEVACVSGGVVKSGLFVPTGVLVSAVLVAWYH